MNNGVLAPWSFDHLRAEYSGKSEGEEVHVIFSVKDLFQNIFICDTPSVLQ